MRNVAYLSSIFLTLTEDDLGLMQIDCLSMESVLCWNEIIPGWMENALGGDLKRLPSDRE